MYADFESTLLKLPDEIAGKLFKELFYYIKTGQRYSGDLLLEIALTPLYEQIDRDSDKWEITKESRSHAGKESARIKAERKLQQTSTNSTNVKSVEQNQQGSTNSTVSVNVNGSVSDNVIVNENVNKKQKVRFNFENIEWFKNEQANKVFIDLLKNRVELKKAPTQRAIELMVKRARENFKTSKELIEAIENSIASGWPDIYPPKPKPIKPRDESYFSRAERGINLK